MDQASNKAEAEAKPTQPEDEITPQDLIGAAVSVNRWAQRIMYTLLTEEEEFLKNIPAETRLKMAVKISNAESHLAAACDILDNQRCI